MVDMARAKIDNLNLKKIANTIENIFYLILAIFEASLLDFVFINNNR